MYASSVNLRGCLMVAPPKLIQYCVASQMRKSAWKAHLVQALNGSLPSGDC